MGNQPPSSHTSTGGADRSPSTPSTGGAYDPSKQNYPTSQTRQQHQQQQAQPNYHYPQQQQQQQSSPQPQYPNYIPQVGGGGGGQQPQYQQQQTFSGYSPQQPYPPAPYSQQQQQPYSPDTFSHANANANNNNPAYRYGRSPSDTFMAYDSSSSPSPPPSQRMDNKFVQRSASLQVPPIHPSSQQQFSSTSPTSLAALYASEEDTVPTVFRWEHGGRQVYITGTFNGWSRQIPMHRSGNDFTYIHNLKRGKHAFKFIVDDEWRFAPDQPTVADIEGRINNFIDVTEFKPYMGDKGFEKDKAAADYGCYFNSVNDGGGGGSSQGVGKAMSMNVVKHTSTGKGGESKRPSSMDRDTELYGTHVPDFDEYTKEPPPLPPHLRHIILNKPPQLQDTAALPVPQHVALNHLYCTAIKDNMMVLGITQRFRTKFVTTVYYSPCD